MSLRKKILLGFLAALIVLVGAVTVAFWDEIHAVVVAMRYSPEELEQQMAQNDQAFQAAAQYIPDYTIREMTEEEKQGLKDGTLTPEELVESIVIPVQPSGQLPDASTPESGQPSTPSATTTKPGQAPVPVSPSQNSASSQQFGSKPVQVNNFQKELAALFAEVYLLQAEFTGKLDNLLSQAKAEYLSIPAGERKAKLSGLVGKYFSMAYSLETECDARMKDIIGRMETLLKANGGDLSIAQTVMDAYLSEKSLKKSWYLSELKKRGI